MFDWTKGLINPTAIQIIFIAIGIAGRLKEHHFMWSKEMFRMTTVICCVVRWWLCVRHIPFQVEVTKLVIDRFQIDCTGRGNKLPGWGRNVNGKSAVIVAVKELEMVRERGKEESLFLKIWVCIEDQEMCGDLGIRVSSCRRSGGEDV